jgi:hypothetical protein
MEASQEAMKHTKLKIHFFYVVLILGLFVVSLITRDWTKIDGFIDYLNVAAGVTSIALGILAIIYSFVSTGSFNQSLGAIEGSASRVAKIADELGGVLKSGQSLQSRAEKRTDELHELVIHLRTGLDALATTTTEIAGSVAAIPDRISSLQKAAGRESTEAEATAAPSKWDKAAVETYLKRSSVLGFVAIYSAAQASLTEKYVDLKKLFGSNHEYVWGYLIASSAAGIIRLEYPEGQSGNRIVRLKEPQGDLADAVAQEWTRRSTTGKEFQRKMVGRYKVEDSFVDGTTE